MGVLDPMPSSKCPNHDHPSKARAVKEASHQTLQGSICLACGQPHDEPTPIRKKPRKAKQSDDEDARDVALAEAAIADAAAKGEQPISWEVAKKALGM